MKKSVFLLVCVFLFAAVFFVASNLAEWQRGNINNNIVGNDSDIHGCKASAGYSWCEAKQKCLRMWEDVCVMACTEEAKVCPDGSAVGRNGSKNCEFDACPGGLTESEAISLLKNSYPEFKDYPNDKLAPQSIKTEKTGDGWYVAFIQEGSGRPIISAKCFYVDNQKNIVSMRLYNPALEEDSAAEFSARTCSPGNCALETCHGLEISCGPNPAGICTAMYQIGDNCLQYARCGIQNGKCLQIENAQFTKCKSCVLKCMNDHNNDNSNRFECESKCDEIYTAGA